MMTDGFFDVPRFLLCGRQDDGFFLARRRTKKRPHQTLGVLHHLWYVATLTEWPFRLFLPRDATDNAVRNKKTVLS